MPYLILGFAALIIILVLSNRFVKADIQKMAANLRLSGGALAMIFALGMFLTGRVAIAVPAAAIAFMLFQRAHLAKKRAQKTPGKSSEVRTDYLQMVLDHDSGKMHGTILKGRWKGKTLDTLTYSRLLDLWKDCSANDSQSEQLLAAYLDRTYPNWRDDVAEAKDEDQGTASGAMTLDEAYDILGLHQDATEEQVNQAHRKLMKSYHPDHGGSNYLAAKINQAKDIILKKIG